ncbi:hypothetical protein KCP91_12005 [Microvirga sp. SRT01]|uniref:DUF4240 domain-containing protein n=1 Tax=Sphingomonas longa TaxID=2778730 RepID=A0ABS2DAI9_9SPHN|nr:MULTISPECIES: hypothetical protein [Alphaproteobacteria]MBM6577096.1 hypothetical protein [Sphingomonas sp. BT552]MBR7710140.1 hypothetical protein [Microvirga sp. SRT01]
MTLTAPSVDEADEFWTAFTAGEDYRDVENVIADKPGEVDPSYFAVWEDNNRPVSGYMVRRNERCVDMDWGYRNIAPIDFFETMKRQGWHVEAFFFEPAEQFCGKWFDGQVEVVDYKTFADIPEYIEVEFASEMWMFDDEDEDEDEDEQSSD